ncbi:PP2C family protein-serine/threonine phosphatase [Entomomonas asaccharolytica]|uniref:Serine/threonine-protein phosphatase n=1 Tax=Entomomonas asaccharolytica TaxID=2785331 RepID=A0A974NGE7_9GAMM|nr:PP2C family serine/threonine-protein phosphatase [Entomomonas asaccharolytica]QQP86019.1 serine/threonine-protein phosphatase [Entomomonas asaccharolytica]
MLLRSAARTDQGKVREKNEDAFINYPDRKIWVVADGMGGHDNGEIASRMVVEALADLELSQDFDERVKQITRCLRYVNKQLTQQDKTVVKGQLPPIMGTTVVALLIEDYRMACIWAGDSRCYLFRKGNIYQVTKDHAVWQELMDEQQLSMQEAQQQKGSFALTRAVGADEELSLGIVEMEIAAGDRFLLCSDGIYQYVSYDQLYQAMSKASPHLAIEQLFHDVLATEAKDNLTAIIVVP